MSRLEWVCMHGGDIHRYYGFSMSVAFVIALARFVKKAGAGFGDIEGLVYNGNFHIFWFFL